MLVPTTALKPISPAIRAFRRSCLRPKFRCLGHATSLRRLSNISVVRSHRLPPWIKYGVPILVGGGLLYAFDEWRGLELHDPIISPAFIPRSRKQTPSFVIPSPPDITLFEKITNLLRKYVFSPLRTGLRFLHLFFIFSPVIITSPMLFIGVSEPQYGGERWGAVWWYALLTTRMQRAGPTFIKVSVCLISLLGRV
jgi:aarF domain-containing kinase